MAERRVTPDAPPTPEIGVVGLGAMGLPMARRLAQQGPVLGVDVDPVRRSLAQEHGVAATDAAAGLRQCAAVLIMVATADHLSELLDAVEGDVPPGQVWLLAGTYGPDPVASAAKRLQNHGAVVLDCPVTGGVRGAESGELLLFCGGERTAYGQAAPVLSALGTPHHVGQRPGDGQRLKAVNQLLCSIHLVATAEALAVAEHAGLEPTLVLDLLRQGAAGSWMLQDRGPLMLTPPPVARSTVDVFVKDSAIAIRLAEASGATVPLLRAAAEQFRWAHDAGLGAHDDSQVIDAYRGHCTPPRPSSPNEGSS